MLAITETLHHNDMSIWVFPEGTRSHGKGLGQFKKGAFQMAISAGVPIIPLCANNYVRALDLNRWHSGDIILRALSPISTTGMTIEDVPALIERCREQMKTCIAGLDQETGTNLSGSTVARKNQSGNSRG